MKNRDDFYALESKPKNLKQWLHKHDTWALVIFALVVVSIFYLP